MTDKSEPKLAPREHAEFTAYVVEVCQGCASNHSAHSALSDVLGDGSPRKPPRRRRTMEDDD